MPILLQNTEELGRAIRAVRRHAGVRIDDLAATVGVSKQFIQDAELGKPTVRLGLVLRTLEELGIQVTLDLPPGAEAELARLKAEGVRRRANRPRTAPPAGAADA